MVVGLSELEGVADLDLVVILIEAVVVAGVVSTLLDYSVLEVFGDRETMMSLGVNVGVTGVVRLLLYEEVVLDDDMLEVFDDLVILMMLGDFLVVDIVAATAPSKSVAKTHAIVKESFILNLFDNTCWKTYERRNMTQKHV